MKQWTHHNSAGFNDTFNLDDNGIIQDPGKFEGECYYAPYYHDLSMNGCQDDVRFDGNIQIDLFNLGKDDFDKFPKLEGYNMLELWIDDNGFVNCAAWGN